MLSRGSALDIGVAVPQLYAEHPDEKRALPFEYKDSVVPQPINLMPVSLVRCMNCEKMINYEEVPTHCRNQLQNGNLADTENPSFNHGCFTCDSHSQNDFGARGSIYESVMKESQSGQNYEQVDLPPKISFKVESEVERVPEDCEYSRYKMYSVSPDVPQKINPIYQQKEVDRKLYTSNMQRPSKYLKSVEMDWEGTPEVVAQEAGLTFTPKLSADQPLNMFRLPKPKLESITLESTSNSTAGKLIPPAFRFDPVYESLPRTEGDQKDYHFQRRAMPDKVDKLEKSQSPTKDKFRHIAQTGERRIPVVFVPTRAIQQVEPESSGCSGGGCSVRCCEGRSEQRQCCDLRLSCCSTPQSYLAGVSRKKVRYERRVIYVPVQVAQEEEEEQEWVQITKEEYDRNPSRYSVMLPEEEGNALLQRSTDQRGVLHYFRRSEAARQSSIEVSRFMEPL